MRQAEVEQVKKFQFFNQENIQDQRANGDPTAPTLNDIGISDGCGIGTKLFLSSQSKNLIYVYEANSIQGCFQPHNESFRVMKCTRESREGKLVTFGIDSENNQKSSFVKFWDPNTTDYQNMKPIKVILVNKVGQPLQNFNCFCIAKDLSAMAFGLQDGQILIFKAKSQNLMTMDFKDQVIQTDQEPIKSVHLSRQDQNLNLFCTTDSNIICFQNMQNRKKFSIPAGAQFDLTAKGTLIGCPKDDTSTIVEYSDTKKEATWNVDGDKIEVRFFKQNYLIMLISPRQDKEQVDQSVQLTIFDLLNNYIAYYKKFEKIQRFIPVGDYLYVITQNNRGEKNLIRLTEKENTHKIEIFFKNNYFDVMYRFASNQSSDKTLLAEISRLHGDHLYDQHDFQGAIKQYINTAGILEPSYVIGKFLDVSHVDFLIQYLAALHHEKQADKNHTALLLNCYVKQKQITKLEEFLKESSFDSDLFDIDTAIKECRQLGHIDLALRLAKSRQKNEAYLSILIETNKDQNNKEQNRQDCKSALMYIREEIQLDEKAQYLKEFGQQLMKAEPELCLEIIQNLVLLISMVQNLKKRIDSQKGIESISILTPEELKVWRYFNLSDEEIKKVFSITFGKPDEFLHLFVVNDEYLESYLKFLIENCKTLPNEKAIFHRYFEYHLEKYQLFYKDESKIGIRDTQLQSKEQGIMKLLENQENEKKYDKNHLLVLFKMYNFVPGIIFLLKKLQMREELLNFYISLKQNDQIINLCSEYGREETNLWIQALKYFAKPENGAENYIEKVLVLVSSLENLSPLLILNILSKNRNVNFKLVKNYFTNKISKDKKQIDDCQKVVKEKMKKATELRAEYKKLKTQAKVFQSTKCNCCDAILSLPSYHFLCGHSYHEHCIHTERACLLCPQDTQMFFKRKQEFIEASKETKPFKEKLYAAADKFDVICEYLGQGIISNQKAD
ncbi:unnamed protein product (macronuclear) [Paramecium tetraurelia]|uniref:Vacuolar protein sorting-associated protein 11 homolog n=1 Tax=Paramecium tetraurelia TaxID=5888 RepID=A0DH18_PARTE|nr:uncharacterized protein GSPATT00002464001 [Paramecium tetraurelia]CAK82335.1 unnamed protein product [Paramecium tetraurelia]|eukprot:XP_001449732.1 hypothetical protein (macronuclear) [Paramecium tetraurelia strain d4-2]